MITRWLGPLGRRLASRRGFVRRFTIGQLPGVNFLERDDGDGYSTYFAENVDGRLRKVVITDASDLAFFPRVFW
jgi:hypothetical protein